ncbi:winged helix-turn-helix domain-containing protein [Catellatospora methionotrophica]|uniref:winged helix-turn-helix domain-containing protein n=1 Tax=Catellatospora methionotrophica TaxID=121620 RepID=UPI00340BC41A
MPVPMSYTQIADDLADRIKSGEYPPGSKLPSYNELSTLYSVHFGTIARVIALLRDRGVVIGSPGRGTFVPD